MNKLKSPKDEITIGGLAGETLESSVRKYGRKSILEILKWYEISDELMKEYHYHNATDEEKEVWNRKMRTEE